MLQIFRNLRLVPLTRRSVVNIRWYSSEDNSSDDEKKKVEKHDVAKKKSEDAIKRLNDLLNSMSAPALAKQATIVTAKNKRQEGRDRKNKELQEKLDDPNNLEAVTKKIAETIGGDVKKTEAELLSTFLGVRVDQKASSLSDIIGGLKVEKEEHPQRQPSRAQMVRAALEKSSQSVRPQRFTRRERKPTEVSIVDLFGATPLNIFERASTAIDPCTTWSSLEKRELRLAVTHPPRNYFEKMALWTEQGKVWKFPIDNEQGWEEEHKTDFTEHVMLEMHLDWCPQKGPIRHFMELVCVGLSKNNFLSAKEKRDHLIWYKEYFEGKKDMLGELLTLGDTNEEKKVEA